MKKFLLAGIALFFATQQLYAQKLEISSNDGWQLTSSKSLRQSKCDKVNNVRTAFRATTQYNSQSYYDYVPASTLNNIFFRFKLYSFNNVIATKTTGIIDVGAYPLYSTFEQNLINYVAASNGQFVYGADKKLSCTFDNVVSGTGHAFEVEIEIWYNNQFSAPIETTNSITVNISGTDFPGSWYHREIQPSFASMATGQVSVDNAGQSYFVGTDNRLYNTRWVNNRWNIWSLDWNFTSAAPGAVSKDGDLYFIGTDNRVYQARTQNNQWNIWCLDWNFTSAASGAIAAKDNVYFIGTDNRVYHAKWQNNQWNIWCLDWNFTSAAPGAIAADGNVYFIGTDNRVYHAKWQNNQWNIWCLDWNFTSAAPGAIAADGDPYFIGTDNRIYQARWQNNQWNIWCIDWNYTNAAPGAIAVSGSGVYFIDNAHHLCRAEWNGQWIISVIDNNYQAQFGTLGVNTRTINNQREEIVHSKNSENQMQQHVRITCLSATEAPQENGVTAITEHMQAYEMADKADSMQAYNTSKNEVVESALAVNSLPIGHNNLLKITPNPVEEEAIVSYSISNKTNVQLSLVDMTGRTVRQMVNGQKNTGTYTYRLEKNNLPAGIYYLVMQAGTHQKLVEKVVIK